MNDVVDSDDRNPRVSYDLRHTCVCVTVCHFLGGERRRWLNVASCPRATARVLDSPECVVELHGRQGMSPPIDFKLECFNCLGSHEDKLIRGRELNCVVRLLSVRLDCRRAQWKLV